MSAPSRVLCLALKIIYLLYHFFNLNFVAGETVENWNVAWIKNQFVPFFISLIIYQWILTRHVANWSQRVFSIRAQWRLLYHNSDRSEWLHSSVLMPLAVCTYTVFLVWPQESTELPCQRHQICYIIQPHFTDNCARESCLLWPHSAECQGK